MKKSVKAALLSALVFPGVGHFLLKRYARGLVLFVLTVLALVFVGNHTMQMASSIVDKIMSGEIAPDAQTIAALISATPDGSDALMLNLATLVMIVCWVVGIADSWRIGRIADTAEAENGKR
jgi:hypothetical protein